MPYQLRNTRTDNIEHGPSELPENWGPMFGLPQWGDIGAINEKLKTLPDYSHYTWEEVSVEDSPADPEKVEADARSKVKALLRESDWTMLSDVVMTNEQKAQWMEYRALLRSVSNQQGFPVDITWPIMPTIPE
jgi:hypothetical protein